MTAFVDVHTYFFGADVGIKAGGPATAIADAAIQEAWAMAEDAIQEAWAMSKAASNFEGSATAIINESAAMLRKLRPHA